MSAYELNDPKHPDYMDRLTEQVETMEAEK